MPDDLDEIVVDGCGVFQGRLSSAQQNPVESWIDTQVEESDKSNEF